MRALSLEPTSRRAVSATLRDPANQPCAARPGAMTTGTSHKQQADRAALNSQCNCNVPQINRRAGECVSTVFCQGRTSRYKSPRACLLPGGQTSRPRCRTYAISQRQASLHHPLEFLPTIWSDPTNRWGNASFGPPFPHNAMPRSPAGNPTSLRRQLRTTSVCPKRTASLAQYRNSLAFASSTTHNRPSLRFSPVIALHRRMFHRWVRISSSRRAWI